MTSSMEEGFDVTSPSRLTIPVDSLEDGVDAGHGDEVGVGDAGLLSSPSSIY